MHDALDIVFMITGLARLETMAIVIVSPALLVVNPLNFTGDHFLYQLG